MHQSLAFSASESSANGDGPVDCHGDRPVHDGMSTSGGSDDDDETSDGREF